MEFVKEGLPFTGEDAPIATLLLSVMGALAKRHGAYRGRKKALSDGQVAELRRCVVAAAKAGLARELGISRETLYQYLRAIP